MRRPINWVVFCLSLAVLFVNLSFGRKPAYAMVGAVTPSVSRVDVSYVTRLEPDALEFGYVNTDGSFSPMVGEPRQLLRPAREASALTSGSPSWQ